MKMFRPLAIFVTALSLVLVACASVSPPTATVSPEVPRIQLVQSVQTPEPPIMVAIANSFDDGIRSQIVTWTWWENRITGSCYLEKVGLGFEEIDKKECAAVKSQHTPQ